MAAAGVRVVYDDAEVRRMLRHLPGVVDKAVARGLNKGATQGRTQARLQIKARRNLPSREITKGISIKKANRRNLVATIAVSGRNRSLRRYGARVVGKRGRGKKTTRNAPVQVAVIPGQRKVVTGAFIRFSDGNVFKRQGAARYPLQMLFGPSTQSAFTKPEVEKHMGRWAQSKVPSLIEHELRRELERVGG